MQKGDAMDAAERSERIPDIVIITGMSGSGRTQAMHVFEDMGYFCIDNLPPRLIAQLAELVGINTGVGRHLAVTCDLRSQGLFDELLDAVAALEEREMSCDIVLLEASDEVLIRRYSENRRRHPIAKGRTDYSENFSFFKRESDAFQNLGLPEILFQIFNFKYRHLFSLLI